jgi:hypothetical protein
LAEAIQRGTRKGPSPFEACTRILSFNH